MLVSKCIYGVRTIDNTYTLFIGPPADHDPSKLVYFPVAGNYVTTAEQQKGINYMVTTLPLLPPFGRDPDGHTECMIERKGIHASHINSNQ